MRPPPSSLLDASALSLSGLCLAHCLALPLVAAASPLLAAWAEAEWIHAAAVASAAPISLFALTRQGSPRGGLILGLCGLAALAAAAFVLPHAIETPATVAGGLILAAAHVLNWRGRHAH